MFSCEIWEIFKNTFFHRTPPVAASVIDFNYKLNRHSQLIKGIYPTENEFDKGEQKLLPSICLNSEEQLYKYSFCAFSPSHLDFCSCLAVVFLWNFNITIRL